MLKELRKTHKQEYIQAMKNNDFLYNYAIYEKNDIAKIDKLMQITSLENFWDNVRKLTKKVYSDHSIARWQGLSELRYAQLEYQKELKGE